MTPEIRIKSIEVASHKFDESAPPSYGAMTIEVGGKPIRLILQQPEIDALLIAVEPVMMDCVREVSEVLNSRAA